MSVNFSLNENSSVASEERASVLRVKYRPPAVQPELNQAVCKFTEFFFNAIMMFFFYFLNLFLR